MKKETKKILKGVAFISPWIIGFLAFQLYPVCSVVYYSFCHYDVLRAPAFIGLENYQNLAIDAVFIKSLINTAIYASMAIPSGLLISLFFAILLNQKIIGKGVFRTIFFLPSLVPLVALAILWQWIFNGEYGICNHLLSLIGITGPNWLGSTMWATPAIVVTGIWGIGGSIVIYLAALQDVPKFLYESADLDGANWYHKVRHVTIPMISPVIFFNLIMAVIGCLQVFVLPFIMTAGGPARSTYYYTMYLFDNAFNYLKMGYASAMAVILFFIILALTFLTTKLASRKVHYAE
jgi:multiple sugar transport system permease protein